MSGLYEDDEDDDVVPEGQKRAAMQNAEEKIKQANYRLTHAHDYTERKRAEYDLAGAQAALRKYGGWRTK
jgi:hypothetical protein